MQIGVGEGLIWKKRSMLRMRGCPAHTPLEHGVPQAQTFAISTTEFADGSMTPGGNIVKVLDFISVPHARLNRQLESRYSMASATSAGQRL
jgi:hypothetical protein